MATARIGGKFSYSDLAMIWDDDSRDKKLTRKRKNKLTKKYEYQKSMMYAIQGVTGELTHEILANLVEEADKQIAKSNINLKYSPTDDENRSSGPYRTYSRRVNERMFYPGTKLYISICVEYAPDEDDYSKFDSVLKYNFKLPAMAVKLNSEEFDVYMAESILCGASKDVEWPIIKNKKNK